MDQLEDQEDPRGEWSPPAGGGTNGKKKRFSEEQIRSLESMFRTQAKLEPRQKLALANDLGLQPRQVAIWFQNKRARWKSKQLERQYAALRHDYDNLLLSFDSLSKEKHNLLKQLERLRQLLSAAWRRGDDGRSGEIANNSIFVPGMEETDGDCCNGRSTSSFHDFCADHDQEPVATGVDFGAGPPNTVHSAGGFAQETDHHPVQFSAQWTSVAAPEQIGSNGGEPWWELNDESLR